MNKQENLYTKFVENTYSGKELLKKHSIHDGGEWLIKGEDLNCDFGGSHYQPTLGVVSGLLDDVIEYAVNLPGFWSWGGGGSIEKISIIPITSKINEKRANLLKEEKDLEFRLEEVRKNLGRKS